MKKPHQLLILIGAICAYNLSSFSWWAQPEIVHTLIDKVGLSDSRAGLVVSIELLAIAFTAFIVSPWVSRLDVKKVCYTAGAIAIAGHFFSASTMSVEILFVTRLVTGMAEGLILAIANAALASTKNPDRSYALLNTWNVASGVVLLMIMPFLEQKYGPVAVFGLIGIACLLMMPLFRHLPLKIEVVQRIKISGDRIKTALVMILSLLVWGTASAMTWAFYISIGTHTTLQTSTVGLIAAVAAFGGLVGGSFAVYVSGNYGRYIPFYIALLAHAVIAMTLTHVFHNWVFILMAPAAIACVYFILPLYLGMAAEYDPNGGLPAAMAGVFLLTGGTGPLFGGYLVEYGGVQFIGWAILIGCIFAALCNNWLTRRLSAT